MPKNRGFKPQGLINPIARIKPSGPTMMEKLQRDSRPTWEELRKFAKKKEASASETLEKWENDNYLAELSSHREKKTAKQEKLHLKSIKKEAKKNSKDTHRDLKKYYNSMYGGDDDGKESDTNESEDSTGCEGSRGRERIHSISSSDDEDAKLRKRKKRRSEKEEKRRRKEKRRERKAGKKISIKSLGKEGKSHAHSPNLHRLSEFLGR